MNASERSLFDREIKNKIDRQSEYKNYDIQVALRTRKEKVELNQCQNECSNKWSDWSENTGFICFFFLLILIDLIKEGRQKKTSIQ